MKLFNLLFLLSVHFLTLSCITNNKEFKKSEEIKIEEFENIVKIEEIKVIEEKPLEAKSSPIGSKQNKIEEKTSDKKKKASNQKTEKEKKEDRKEIEPGKIALPVEIKEKTKTNRMPELEDAEGFSGRRPQIIPYDVGEEIVLGLSYFGVEAGKFTMQVRPLVQVNGNKSYHFRYIIKSSPLFSMFYSVDDVAETFVDYETLVPYSYEIHVNETKQVRETRTFFNHKSKKAILWDKKIKKNEPVENTKIEWDLLEYPQNVFSAAYYLRNFTLRVGKKLKINVGHEGKNILMTAEVIRKEKIYTALGAFNTFVVKPSFDVDGKFKPTGENFLWLTADDKKIIVRLESKIKIGSIIGEVQKISK